MKGASYRGGFTLIELLAVIAIVLLLASLLVPAVAAAQDRTRRSVCRSNMQKLQIGYYLRTIDANGDLPYGGTTGTNAWAVWNDFRQGSIWPYVETERVYTCPSYPQPARDQLGRHYSVSGFMHAEGGSWGIKYDAKSMSQVKTPMKVHVLVEEFDRRSSSAGPFSGPQGAFVAGYGGGYTGNWVDTPMFWHDWGAHFTYLDGHVEYRKWAGPKMQTVNIYTWRHTVDGKNWPTTPGDAEDLDFIVAGVTNGYIQ